MDVSYAESLANDQLIFRFLGFALSYEPSEQLMSLVCDKGFLDALEDVNLGVDGRAGVETLRSWAQGIEAQSDDCALEDARAQWMGVLVGAGSPYAAPWESVYVDPDHLLFGASTLDVRRWYRRFGFESKDLNREPEDHIGIMMSFLAVMAERESKAMGDTARQLVQAQVDFIEAHVLTFIGLWAERVEQLAKSRLYEGLALVAVGAVACRVAHLKEALAMSAVSS